MEEASGQSDDGAQLRPAFLDAEPPPWATRGLANLIMALAVAGGLLSALLKVNETVSCPFVLVLVEARDPLPAALQAELTVSPAGIGHLKRGQRVRLLYDAFPYQRYGVRYGTLHSIGPAGSGERPAFQARADIDDVAAWVDGEVRPLRAGMGGIAKIVVGRRSLISFVLDPIRQLRENFAEPSTAKR
jgi:hypothetical protein